MDNILMAGLSRQLALTRQVDALANNIANASTTGFKAEFLVAHQTTEAPASSTQGPRDVIFAAMPKMLRDFTQGPLEQTSRPLDLAIKGDGFFQVTTPNGNALTRDGAFALSPTGTLVTKEGNPVLSDAGAPIVIPPDAQEISISPDGAVSTGTTIVGRVGVFTVKDQQALVPMGGNNFSAAGAAAAASPDAIISQGFLEGSNVKPIVQMTQLLEASKTYEAITRTMKAEEDLRSRAIDRLGRPQ